MHPRALVLPLAALFLMAKATAQETLFGHQPDPKSKTRIECVALFSRPSPAGYLPVRVTVVNANETDGNIEIRTTSSDGGYNGNGSELTSTFKLGAPAGKTTRHDILVPCTTLMNNGYGYGGGGSVNVSLSMSGSFGSVPGNLSGNYGQDQPAILMSEPLFTKSAGTLDSELNSHGSGSGMRYGGGMNFAAKFNPAEMPDDWRAYSGYDGMVMTDTDWTSMSPGAHTAILRWNRMGGRLVILATSTNSDLATLGIATSATGEKYAARSLGSVLIEPLPGGSLVLDSAAAQRLISRFNAGKDVLPPMNQSVNKDFAGSWPLHSNFDAKSYNYAVFIIILIAFGILVGPVNLFVFAKSGQRHRLFITTPLIALGTSVLLIGLIIIIDGFGGRGIRVALMEVRPEDGENSAYLMQEQVSRTGVLLGASFTVDQPVAITPVPLSAASQWSRLTDTNNGGGMRYEMTLQDNKMDVEGDWFQSRSEQGQSLSAVIPTRGRIELRGGGGTSTIPSMVSTFEFPIDKLYYTDASGTYWCAENIEPGKAFSCREVQLAEVQQFVKGAGAQFSARTRKGLYALSPEVTGGAVPPTRGKRHFIALATKAPGVQTFKGIDWQRTATYVTGPILVP